MANTLLAVSGQINTVDIVGVLVLAVSGLVATGVTVFYVRPNSRAQFSRDDGNVGAVFAARDSAASLGNRTDVQDGVSAFDRDRMRLYRRYHDNAIQRSVSLDRAALAATVAAMLFIIGGAVYAILADPAAGLVVDLSGLVIGAVGRLFYSRVDIARKEAREMYEHMEACAHEPERIRRAVDIARSMADGPEKEKILGELARRAVADHRDEMTSIEPTATT